MTLTDLYERLLAEIYRRDPVAQAARAERGEIVSWNVDQERRYAHYRRVLERHKPCKDLNVWEHGESHPACTHGFDDEDDITDAIWWHRCPEVTDLAEAIGVNHDVY